ncbi:MAG: hypothetical protein ACP5PW_06225, partial [Candidatus Dormibacteria bacterium]
ATAILERARVLSPEAAGTAAPPSPEPDRVAMVEVPPLEDATGSEVTGANALPDLTLWGPGVAGATAAGALDSISVAGMATPEQHPGAVVEPEAEPNAGLLEPLATPADLAASLEHSTLEGADGLGPAASIEGDIAPWPAAVHPDQGVGGAADGAGLDARTAEEDPVGAPPGSRLASSPLADGVPPSEEEGWMPGASGVGQLASPDAAGAEAVEEGIQPAGDLSAPTVEDSDPVLQEEPGGRDAVSVDYQPVASSLWADGFTPDATQPLPPVADEAAPLDQTDEYLGGLAPSREVTDRFREGQLEAPPPASDLPDRTVESSAIPSPSADGSLDPILGDEWGTPPGGDEPQADGQAAEPPEAPTDNPWAAAEGADSPTDAAGPWQRSWEPDPLPVWSPALPPIPPWPSESAVAEEQGSGEEVMEVAKEEAAGLEGPAAPAEVPVWIPPPPSLPSSVTDSWVPKRDLLDIPTQPPTPTAAEPLSPPVRPVDSVVPPRRAPSEETAGYQRIPPPHRPDGPGRRPVAPRPPSPGPRSWTRTGTIAVAALAVFLIGWALTHHSTSTPAPVKTAQSTPTPTSSHSPAASPSAPATTAPSLTLTGEQTFGGGGSGYQMQTARYGLHQNGTQLWVVFQMVSGSGSPKITTGFDGATTLYVEMQGVSPGVAVPQPPSGELVTSVKVGHVPGFNGAVYILQLSRAAQVTGYLLPGTDTGSAGERVVLQLQ